MITEKDIVSKLTGHEKAITGIVEKHRAAASKLEAEISAAQNTLANFETLPTADSVSVALAAQSTVDSGKKLLALLGPIERREATLRDSYVAQNSPELIALVASLQEIRTRPRDPFRKATAAKLATHHASISLNPEDWPALKQVENLERELNAPEFALNRAGEALRDFRNQPAYASFLRGWREQLRVEYPSA